MIIRNRLTFLDNYDKILSDEQESDFLFVNNLAQSRLRKFNRFSVISPNAPVFFIVNKLTPACRLLLSSLWYKRNYFSKKNMLAKDGSFYYSDKLLAEELGLNEKTIRRAKEFLEKNKYITFISGKFKRTATKYWVIRGLLIGIPKGDNLSGKGDKMSKKAPQNVQINNINNNIMKKDNFLPSAPPENWRRDTIRSLN